MVAKCLRAGFVSLLILAGGCRHKSQAPPPVPAPPAPKQNLVVLLPDPGGKPGGIVVSNPAGAQTLSEPYQAVRVENSNTAPTPPFTMGPAEVRRLFGAVLDALPAAEVAFTLYFGENTDALVAESQAQLPAILDTIRARRSSAISLVGHTDTTGDPQANYQLGLRRAQAVAAIFQARGVDTSDLSVESHGDTDLLVKTGRSVVEPRNRRVEVIVR